LCQIIPQSYITAASIMANVLAHETEDLQGLIVMCRTAKSHK